MTQMTFFDEIKLYFFWGGFVQLFWAVVAAPFIYLIARRVSDASDHTLFSCYGLLNVFLLIWGCLGSAIFMSLASGKLYVSVDRMVDFYPYIPFGQWILDDGFGGDSHGALLGHATLWHVRMIWLATALPVWVLAVASTKLVLPHFLSHFAINTRKIRRDKPHMSLPNHPPD